jgi:dTDP-4-amino-4,6-dideoxygalactose transaminase
VFADCGEDYTIDLGSAEGLVREKTRAIIPVHLYGQCANMDEVNRFANKHGLFIIEDAAQAHGAKDRGTRAGSMCGLGTFSFYPGKILGAYGDGGAIVTNDSVRADRMRKHANHGRDGAGGHVMAGRNSRLDGIQAAILSVKLQHVDEWIRKRQDQARLYGRLLEGLPLRLPVQREGVRHVYHLFVIRTTRGDRNDLRAFLDDRGVQTGLHYARCIPEWPAFSGYRAVAENARRWQDQLLSLPIGEHLNADEIHFVSETLRSFF